MLSSQKFPNVIEPLTFVEVPATTEGPRLMLSSMLPPLTEPPPDEIHESGGGHAGHEPPQSIYVSLPFLTPS